MSSCMYCPLRCTAVKIEIKLTLTSRRLLHLSGVVHHLLVCLYAYLHSILMSNNISCNMIDAFYLNGRHLFSIWSMYNIGKWNHGIDSDVTESLLALYSDDGFFLFYFICLINLCHWCYTPMCNSFVAAHPCRHFWKYKIILRLLWGKHYCISWLWVWWHESCGRLPNE